MPFGTSKAYENVCAGALARALPPVMVPPKLPDPVRLVGTSARTMTGTATWWPPELPMRQGVDRVAAEGGTGTVTATVVLAPGARVAVAGETEPTGRAR